MLTKEQIQLINRNRVGGWKRLFAFLIDFIIIILVVALIGFVLGIETNSAISKNESATIYESAYNKCLGQLNLGIIYMLMMYIEATSAQSIGKKLFKIEVRSRRGYKLDKKTAFKRFYAKSAFAIALIIYCLFVMSGIPFDENGKYLPSLINVAKGLFTLTSVLMILTAVSFITTFLRGKISVYDKIFNTAVYKKSFNPIEVGIEDFGTINSSEIEEQSEVVRNQTDTQDEDFNNESEQEDHTSKIE